MKTSTIRWPLPKQFQVWTSVSFGGTDKITAIGSGSCTVATIGVREGSLIIAEGFKSITSTFQNSFVAIATSTGKTFTYRIISGTDFSLSGNDDVYLLATDFLYNVRSADVVHQTTTTYNGSMLVFPSSVLPGTLVFIIGSTDGIQITSDLVVEISSVGQSPPSYRKLLFNDFVPSGTAYTIWTIANPKYANVLLEDLKVEEVDKINDSDRLWIPARDAYDLEHARSNFAYDGQIVYQMENKGLLRVYRGMSTTDGMFLSTAQIHYKSE